MFSKRGGFVSELVSILATLIGTVVSICVLLYLLKFIGIEVNLGEILADGLKQIRDAIGILKKSI